MTTLDPASPAHTDHLIPTGGKVARLVSDTEDPMPWELQQSLAGLCRRNKTEQCGFIKAGWETFAIDNVHAEPTHNFFMDEKGVKAFLFETYRIHEEEVIGIWHTHPNFVPWPSPRDIAGWPDERLGWRYFVITGDGAREWELKDG